MTKTDFDNSISSLDSKIAANKAKNESIENEFKKLKTFDSSYFIGRNDFEEDGTENYLVFQSLNKYFKVITNTRYISWRSKGLSDKTIKPPSTSNNSPTPVLSYYGTKTRVKFTGSCLKQPNTSYTYDKTVNIYIVYELGASGTNSNDLTLKIVYLVQLLWLKTQILISMGTLVMELDLTEGFSFPGGRFGQNVLMLE